MTPLGWCCFWLLTLVVLSALIILGIQCANWLVDIYAGSSVT